jgi:hypothetical protein
VKPKSEAVGADADTGRPGPTPTWGGRRSNAGGGGGGTEGGGGGFILNFFASR